MDQAEKSDVQIGDADPRSAPTTRSGAVSTGLTRPQSTPHGLDRQSSFSKSAELGRKLFTNFQSIQSSTAEKWLKEKKSKGGGIKNLLKAESPRLGLKYRVVAPIACGMSAVVCKGQMVSTGQPVAIKFMRLSAKSDKFHDDLKRRTCVLEAEIQLQCSHPNVVTLYDFSLSKDYAIYVMEYVPNTLLGAIVKRNSQQRYSESETARYIKGVALALKHCHAQGVVHLDVKLDNILCTSSGEVKLCDFGVATRVSRPGQKVKRSQAAPMFCPPEILREQSCSTKADMWALGVVLYMLLCGYPCFPEKDLNKRILTARYTFPINHWSNVSVMARDLVSRLLVIDTSVRYSAEQVLEHPWIKALDSYSPKVPDAPTREFSEFNSFYGPSNEKLLKMMQVPKKATQFLRELHLSRQMEKTGAGKSFAKLVQVWGEDVLDAVDKGIDELSGNLSAIDSDSFIAKKLSPFAQQFVINKASKQANHKAKTEPWDDSGQQRIRTHMGHATGEAATVPNNVNPKLLQRQQSYNVIPKQPLAWIKDEEAVT